MERRAAVAAKSSERVEPREHEQSHRDDAKDEESPGHRLQITLRDPSRQNVKSNDRGQEHDAVFLDQERGGGKEEKRQPPGKTFCAYSVPPDKGGQDDDRL